MKKIFLAINNRIQTIQSLQFIDLDKGQLDNYETRPNVAYPAVIFSFDTSAETISGNIQRVTSQLIIRVAFDYIGETIGNTPAQILTESLSYFDILDDVKATLHGFTNDEIDNIEHMSTQKENRHDELNVYRMIFEMSYQELIELN